jgi:acyl-CoA reductase-like NAD-dependent aldehyde dehydrogenase
MTAATGNAVREAAAAGIREAELTTVGQLNAAVEQAQAAFERGRHADPDERAGWLEAVAAGLEQDAGALVEIAGRDVTGAHQRPARRRQPGQGVEPEQRRGGHCHAGPSGKENSAIEAGRMVAL